MFNLGYDEEVAKSYPYVAKLTPNWPYNTNPVSRKREAQQASADPATIRADAAVREAYLGEQHPQGAGHG